MNKTRLFIAIFPNPAARSHLREWLDDQDLPSGGVRWQKPERWHLTLAFLGDRSLPNTLRRFRSLPLPPPEPVQLLGAGSFGAAVWIGVQHGAWLAHLARSCQLRLGVDDRRFRAHMTVAYAKHPRGAAGEVAARLQAYSGALWTPTSVDLVQSTLGPTATYNTLDSRPLTPK